MEEYRLQPAQSPLLAPSNPLPPRVLRHHPEIAELLLDGLGARNDRQRIFALGLLLQRVDEVREFEEGAASLATLAERGLTDELFEKLQQDLQRARLARVTLPEPNGLGLDERAEKMWGWYVEWSGIARTVVRRKKDLMRWGFG